MGIHFESFDAHMEKLNSYLLDCALESHFEYDTFPMRLTVMPKSTEQLGLVDKNDEKKKPQKITLIFDINRIDVKCEGDFTITEKALNKIKTLGKNAYLTFLQCHFSARLLLGDKVGTVDGIEADLAKV